MRQVKQKIFQNSTKKTEELRAKSERSKSNPMTEDQYKRGLKELFGDDISDMDYVEQTAQELGYENSREMVEEEFGYGSLGAESYRRAAELSENASRIYSQLYEQYKNAKVSELSKKDIKRAQDFVKNGWNTTSEFTLSRDYKKYRLNS